MALGLALNFGIFNRSVASAPTQAQVNQQLATGGGTDNAKDRMSASFKRERAAAAVLGRVSQKKVMLAAAKVAGAKKG